MIFYKIEQDLTQCMKVDGYTGDLVSLVSEKEFKQMIKNEIIDENIAPKYKNAKCCKASVRRDSISGVMSVISKDKKMERTNFGFIFRKNDILFINAEEKVASWINKMNKDKFHGSFNAARFLYDFLETIIDKDLRYVEELSDRAIKMESAVIKGILDNFNERMGMYRKELITFYRYYTQLVDMGQELQENENSFFDDESIALFEKFTIRAEKLREEIRLLMDISAEVRDAYRGKLDSKQNKNMNMLTIITTLCMPLTISCAWYGMNFNSMPEFNWDYGYLAFFGLNIFLILLGVLFLKKKKIM